LKYVLTLMLLCSAGVNAQTIFSCIGHNGKKVYTDSKLNCKAFGGKVDAEVETITFDSINMHSQYGATVSEEYYNYAFRAYEKIPGYTINIIAESKLIHNHPQLLQQSASKLDKTIVRAISTFPCMLSLNLTALSISFLVGMNLERVVAEEGNGILERAIVFPIALTMLLLSGQPRTI